MLEFIKNIVSQLRAFFFQREVCTQISMFATAAGLSVAASSFNVLATTAEFQAELTFEGHGRFCSVAFLVCN